VKPRYLQQETSHRDRWTVSYLDVITILLIFFVAAAAKTITPQNAPQPAPKAPPQQVKAPAPEPDPLSAIEQKLKETGLAVHREPRGLVISLPQAVLFASGDDRVSAAAMPTVAQIAGAIQPVPNHVQLVGYADSTPIHTRRFHNNWELSAARGLRLLELLTQRYAIDESRLSVSSDGANKPRESNQTAEGRAQNRRVEIVILAN